MGRTQSLLYIAELTLDVVFFGSTRVGRSCYFTLPFPSPRDLWEPVSNAEWIARYLRRLTTCSEEKLRGFVIGDLAIAKRGHGPDGEATTKSKRPSGAICKDAGRLV